MIYQLYYIFIIILLLLNKYLKFYQYLKKAFII